MDQYIYSQITLCKSPYTCLFTSLNISVYLFCISVLEVSPGLFLPGALLCSAFCLSGLLLSVVGGGETFWEFTGLLIVPLLTLLGCNNGHASLLAVLGRVCKGKQLCQQTAFNTFKTKNLAPSFSVTECYIPLN